MISLSARKIHPSTSCRFTSEKGSVKQTSVQSDNRNHMCTFSPPLHRTVFMCVCVSYLCKFYIVYAPKPSLFSMKIKIIWQKLTMLTSWYHFVCVDTDMFIVVAAMISSTRWFSSAPSWTWMFWVPLLNKHTPADNCRGYGRHITLTWAR